MAFLILFENNVFIFIFYLARKSLKISECGILCTAGCREERRAAKGRVCACRGRPLRDIVCFTGISRLQPARAWPGRV